MRKKYFVLLIIIIVIFLVGACNKDTSKKTEVSASNSESNTENELKGAQELKLEQELTLKMFSFLEEEAKNGELSIAENELSNYHVYLLAMIEGPEKALKFAREKEDEVDNVAYFTLNIFDEIAKIKKGDVMDNYDWFFKLVDGIEDSNSYIVNNDENNFFKQAYTYFQGTRLQTDLDRIKTEKDNRIKAEQEATDRELNVAFKTSETSLSLEMNKIGSGEFSQAVDFDFTSDELKEGNYLNQSSNYAIQVRLNDGKWEYAYFNSRPLVHEAIFNKAGKYKIDIRAEKDSKYYGKIKTINVILLVPKQVKPKASINKDNTIKFPKDGLGEGYNWEALDANGNSIGYIKDDGITIEEAKLVHTISFSDYGQANTPIFTIQGIQYFSNLKVIDLTSNYSGLTEDLDIAKEMGVQILN